MTRNLICLPLLLPDSIDRDLLQSFIDMRSDKKKPITQRGMDMLLRKLARLEAQGHCPNLLLERSILNDWQDVFGGDTTVRDKPGFIEQHTDRSWAGGLTVVK